MSKPIPFIQHLMPDGRTQMQWIERPQEVSDRAFELIDQGYTLHSEMLGDYRTVSLTIEYPNDEGDAAIEVCQNGPEVLAAVDRLIMEFGKSLNTLH